VTGLDGPFEISEPPTEIVTLLWDPDPNARLWKTVGDWMATRDLLTVSFSYEHLSIGDARPLWRFLAGATGYLVKVVASDTAGYWVVEGRMEKPIYLTSEFLNDWVKWMAASGTKHGAFYFGWTVARTVATGH
jgi:hypothetical protein